MSEPINVKLLPRSMIVLGELKHKDTWDTHTSAF